MELSPGIFAGKASIDTLVKGGFKMFYHGSKGARLSDIRLPRSFRFFLGYPSLSEQDASILSKFGAMAVRVSKAYRSPQYLIVIIHNYCDRLQLD